MDTESLPARFGAVYFSIHACTLSVLSMHIPLIPHPEAQKKLFFSPYFSVRTYLGVNICTNKLFFLFRWHSTMYHMCMCAHTHTWSKVLLRKPLLANLCSCQSRADSCVSNVSQTVIRKSFEILKSLVFLWQPHFLSNSTPLSLKP